MDDHDRYSRLRPPDETPKEELCRCLPSIPVKLMTALSYNPLHCINCNLEVVAEGLPLNDAMIQALAHWRSLYDAVYRLWLDSGGYEAWAEEQLADVDSPVNQLGLSVRKAVDPIRRCYYWYFQNQSVEDFQPKKDCPRCGRAFTNYTKGIFPQFVCEHCSIITVGQ